MQIYFIWQSFQNHRLGIKSSLAIKVGLAKGIITKTNLLNKQNQLNLFCL